MTLPSRRAAFRAAPARHRQTPRVATATAKTACKLAVIPERRFLFLVQTAPEFALQIMKVMADRLRKMNARV